MKKMMNGREILLVFQRNSMEILEKTNNNIYQGKARTLSNGIFDFEVKFVGLFEI